MGRRPGGPHRRGVLQGRRSGDDLLDRPRRDRRAHGRACVRRDDRAGLPGGGEHPVLRPRGGASRGPGRWGRWSAPSSSGCWWPASTATCSSPASWDSASPTSSPAARRPWAHPGRRLRAVRRAGLGRALRVELSLAGFADGRQRRELRLGAGHQGPAVPRPAAAARPLRPAAGGGGLLQADGRGGGQRRGDAERSSRSCEAAAGGGRRCAR